MMNNLLDRKRQILAVAATILIHKGDTGLTMRQIARDLEMSLSNLQYYYPSRKVLLSDLVSDYFESCLDDLETIGTNVSESSLKIRLEKIIGEGLSHGERVSDECKLFREFWAMSARDKSLNKQLMSYYEKYQLLVGEGVTQSKDKKLNLHVGSLLMPYFEGYSITAMSINRDKKSIVGELTQIVTKIIENN